MIDTGNDLSTLVFMAEEIKRGAVASASEFIPLLSPVNVDIGHALLHPEDANRESLICANMVRLAAGQEWVDICQ